MDGAAIKVILVWIPPPGAGKPPAKGCDSRDQYDVFGFYKQHHTVLQYTKSKQLLQCSHNATHFNALFVSEHIGHARSLWTSLEATPGLKKIRVADGSVLPDGTPTGHPDVTIRMLGDRAPWACCRTHNVMKGRVA